MKCCFSLFCPFLKGKCFGAFSRLRRNAMGRISAQMRFLVIIFFSGVFSANANTWYVDSSVLLSGNGTTWLTAWKNISDITGVAAGDTVYISGGPNGSSQTYNLSSYWNITGGSSGNPITYEIATNTDSLHDGTAIFSGPGGNTTFLVANNYFVLSGGDGDGKMHFAVTGFSQIMDSDATITTIQLSHINFGTMMGNTGSDSSGDSTILEAGSQCSNFQLDHCYAFYGDPLGGYMLWFHANGTTWGNGIRIFSNTFYFYMGNNGYGIEVTDSAGNTGEDIYSNLFYGVYTNATITQHAEILYDTGDGNYIRWFDNVMLNCSQVAMAAWGFFPSGNPAASCYHNFYIYNNIICMSSNLPASEGGDLCALSMSPSQSGGGGTCTNVVVANNIVVDYAGGDQALAMNNSGGGGTWVWGANCYLANNTTLNSPPVDGVGSGLSVIDNVNLSSSQAAANFTHYAVNGGTNNILTLVSNAASLIGQGTNLSRFFNQDFAGFFRPAVTNWDIGPYQYNTNGSGTASALPAPTGLQVTGSTL